MATTVELWNSKTTRSVDCTVSQQLIRCEMTIDSDSERSIISNPFLQRTAILVVKKTTLYAFEGREKSCWIVTITTQKIPHYGGSISFVRTLWIRNHLRVEGDGRRSS